MELVSATGDERFAQCASVMDVVQRIAEHNPQDRRIDQLKKTFNLTDTAVLVATVKGAIVGRRLSSMTSLVGPPPPLSKPSFFQRSKIPTVVYRVMVETLLENGLREEAASYVPGIAQDPGCRVEWYLRIGAPIMAIEAGYEGEAPLLIETVMRKFPHHPKVQQEGEKYLRMLGGGG
ncbi:hypothetical protein ADEAN_000292300 [Angomonas deanei]|uniref:Uncharacterized protein n=1 Tax=Angomonas deanei TaxID=59799 RepID=A0A7G2C6L4_9TRYP|nr:hypothetical protein ADEAN_000292300 [Angomonas deanei]